MSINIQKILETMKKYLDIPSPTGNTRESILEIQKDFEKLGLNTKTTNTGALIATLNGQNDDEHMLISAHIDNKSPYDYEFRNRLVDIAEENNINYVVDVYNFYSSDASQCMLQGKDVIFASLGPAIDASHHYERTHIDSIKNTTNLLIKYLV